MYVGMYVCMFVCVCMCVCICACLTQLLGHPGLYLYELSPVLSDGRIWGLWAKVSSLQNWDTQDVKFASPSKAQSQAFSAPPVYAESGGRYTWYESGIGRSRLVIRCVWISSPSSSSSSSRSASSSQKRVHFMVCKNAWICVSNHVNLSMSSCWRVTHIKARTNTNM